MNNKEVLRKIQTSKIILIVRESLMRKVCLENLSFTRHKKGETARSPFHELCELTTEHEQRGIVKGQKLIRVAKTGRAAIAHVLKGYDAEKEIQEMKSLVKAIPISVLLINALTMFLF